MSSIYQTLAELRPDLGSCLFRRGLPRRARLCAVAVAPAPVRRGRAHSASRGLIMSRQARNRRIHRDRHHRSRLGRHPRAQHAAAALVAVAVLRHHRLVGGLLDRLSVLAARQLLHDGAFNWSSREAVVSDLEALKDAARADGREACGGLAAGDRRGSAAARVCARARAVPSSPRTARPVMARAVAAARAIRTSMTTTGSGAASSTRSRKRSAMASAPAIRRRAWARPCLISAAMAGSSAPRSRPSPTTFVLLLALRLIPRPIWRPARRSSRRTARSVTARPARAIATLGVPDLTDAIWLYGSDKTTIVEGIWNGRAGVMPAWTGRLDDTTIKALAVYVHTLGGGEK